MADMMDNSFQSRYNRLPIATYAISDLPRESKTMFCHKHYHREFEVIAVTQGQCEFTIDNICRVASSGDIFLIPPYSIHSGSALPGGEFSYFCFSFDLSLLGEPEFAEQFENGYLDITQDITSDEDIYRELFPVIVSIFRQSETRKSHWEFVVQGQLLHMFGLLFQAGYIRDSNRGEAHSDFGLDVLEILHNTYSQDISSADVAAQLSYCQSYFCRKFRETFSMSFQQYLQQYRLSKARLFLTQNRLSIEEVSEKVGYNSVSYFIRQFHNLYGCTPKQFQKNQATGNRKFY